LASAVEDVRPLPQEVWAAEGFHPRPAASAAVEFHPLPEPLAVAELHRPQPEALAVVESPASSEVEELPAATEESLVVDRTPQVSRYSGSLFRQPLLLVSCPVPGSVGVVQNIQQKQEIQTHSLRSVNGPFTRRARIHKHFCTE